MNRFLLRAAVALLPLLAGGFAAQAQLNGTYTIGGTNPDYATIADAAAALNTLGVSGPVTMNIRTGTYTGSQASLNAIPGASTANRITFKAESNNAADVTLTYNASSTTTNFVFKLNGASFVTIRHLTINPTNATNSRGIEVAGAASNDSIANCIFTQATATAGTSNARSAIFADNLTGTNDVIFNNTITNGNVGIYWSGTSTSNLTANHTISSNTITGTHYQGIYCYYTSGLKLLDNNITMSSSPATTCYSLTSYYGYNSQQVIGNTITNTGGATIYGLRVGYSEAPSTQPGIIADNKVSITGATSTVYAAYIYYPVYQIVRNNVVNSTTSGSNYTLYAYNGEYTRFLNNTINSNATGTTNYAGYLYQSSTLYPGSVYNNNIFSCSTQGVPMYLYNPTMVAACDYNNAWGPGTVTYMRGTPSLSTASLATWRTATGVDQHSISYRPGFISYSNLQPNPADTAVWSIHGRGIQSADNDKDITGAARPTSLAAGVPDLGAYEFVPTSTPPLAVANPVAVTAGSSQTFTFGQDTVAVLNWAAASAVPGSYAVRQYSGVVPAGLPAGSFMYFYTDVALTGTGLDYAANIYYKDPWKGTSPLNESAIRMASKNGSAAWLNYPGTASAVDATRNILSVPGMSSANWYTGLVENCTGSPLAPTITNTPILSPFCPGQTAFLTAVDNGNTTAGITLQWESAPSATGPWTAIAGANGLTYNTPPLAGTTYYRLVARCVPTSQDAPSAVYTVPVADVNVTGTTPAGRCGPGTVTLAATAGPTTSLRWFTAPTGGTAIANGATLTTPYLTATTTFYVEGYSGLCVALTRQPVVATVTPGPAFNATDTMVVCNNAPAQLQVNTAVANYDNYVWSPNANLFTDAAGTTPYTGANTSTVYLKTGVSGLYTVYVNASNSVTNCTAADTIRVYVLPDSALVSVTATPDTICISGTTTLALNPAATYANSLIRWYWSGNGTSFTQIAGAGATSYTSGTITSDTFFRVQARNSANDICITKDKFIYRNNPLIVSTVPGTRCGPGTVPLTATGSAGTAVNWYTAATGGLPVFTGNTYTTPIIPATTTYYVSASTAGSGGSNKDSITALLAGGNGCQGGVMFNITPTVNIVVDSFLARFQTGGSQTAQVYYRVGSYLGNETTAAAWTPVGSAVTLNATAGNSYYINPGATIVMNAGTTYGVYLSYYASYTDGANTFTNADLTLDAGKGLCGAFTSVAGDRTFNGRVLYHKGASCESPRTAVTATVTPSAAFSVTDTQSVCNNAPATLAMTSPAANYNQVTWTPFTNLYSDAAATTPYVANTNASTVYARSATPGFTTYIATGLNTANNCQGMDTAVVFTQPTVTAMAASPDTLCSNGSSTLTISPAAPFFPNSLSWFNSTDNGVSYNPIAGATGISYATPSINDTTWYRVRVRNSAGGTCQDFSRALIVKIPTIADTNNGTRCGVGPVVLEATAFPGYVVNWYTAPSGGSPVFSGNTFTTPTLYNTTTYYVAAGSGGGQENMPSPAPTTSTFITASTGWGLRFTVNATATINTVNIKALNTTAGTASIQIRITDLADVNVAVGTAHTFNIGTTMAVYTIPVNVTLPPGNYKMVMTYSGISNMVRESGGLSFPYTAPSNAVSITAGANGTTTAQTTAAYYWFYNWVISTGCVSERIPVTATVTPAPAVSVTPKVDSICYGQSASFVASSANPGYQYTWNPVQVPGPLLNIQPGASSTYYLAVLDTSTNPLTRLCTWYDTVRAVVLPNPVADVLPQSATTFCAGDSVRLNTPFAPDYTYQWKRNGVNLPGALDSTIVVSAAGTYTVEVVKAGFCTTLSDPELITVNPLPNPVISINNGILYTGNYVAYQWLRGGQTVLGATGQQFVPTQNGDYSVAVTDANGCSNTSSIWRVSNTGVAVSNGIGGVVSVSPNPTTGVLTISSPVKINAVVTTLDGRVVLRQGDAKRVDLGAIADGVYFLRIVDASDGALLKSEKILKAQ